VFCKFDANEAKIDGVVKRCLASHGNLRGGALAASGFAVPSWLPLFPTRGAFRSQKRSGPSIHSQGLEPARQSLPA